MSQFLNVDDFVSKHTDPGVQSIYEVLGGHETDRLLRLAAVRPYQDSVCGMKVVEIGCGIATLAARIAQFGPASLYLADIQPAMLREAADRFNKLCVKNATVRSVNIQMQQVDITQGAPDVKGCDLVFLTSVAMHFSEEWMMHQAIQNALNCLKDGGEFNFAVLSYEDYVCNMPDVYQPVAGQPTAVNVGVRDKSLNPVEYYRPTEFYAEALHSAGLDIKHRRLRFPTKPEYAKHYKFHAERGMLGKVAWEFWNCKRR